ncbi:hypothetical protein ACWGPD_09525 [Streptomyces hirsutus]|uniref:hypothetical protein n=1 Tax=Streptomyces hirsutus TaxID=35620 RepID=UPI00362642F7
MAYIFDTAINGQGPYAGKAFFFRDARYVPYDFATNSATADPISLTDWRLGPPFETGIDAALNGAGQYQNLAFFVRGDQYRSYDWVTGRVRGPYSLTTWNLPPAFASGFDSAFTGQGTQSSKAFFFKGNQYITRDWNTSQITAPSPLSDWKLNKSFLKSIHAFLNGDGQQLGNTFFFRGPHYVRFEWATRNVLGPYHISRWNLRGGIGS